LNNLSDRSRDVKSRIDKYVKDFKSRNIDLQFNVAITDGFTVNCRSRELENIEYHNDVALGVTVYNNQKKGTASTNDLSETSIITTINKAIDISKNTQEDQCHGIPNENCIQEASIDLGIYNPIKMSIDEVINITRECETSAFDSDKRIVNSEGSSFSTTNSEHMIISSNGTFGHYKSSGHYLSCIVIAQEDSSMERDYWYAASSDFRELESPDIVGKKAAKRAISRLGAKAISTRSCPVVFSPEMSSSIIVNFLTAISGPAIYKKASFLLDSIGKNIFPDYISLKEVPLIKGGSGTRPFDSDGVVTQDKIIVNDGVLETYLLDTYSSRKLNQKCTGNGVITNIVIESKNEYPQDILKTMGNGILITEMMGSGANSLTGDYSRGAFGYLIENGKIIAPVTEITVASNLKDMLKNIICIGDDFDHRGNIRTGSILIDNISIGGKS
jgi:PmbA protein